MKTLLFACVFVFLGLTACDDPTETEDNLYPPNGTDRDTAPVGTDDSSTTQPIGTDDTNTTATVGTDDSNTTATVGTVDSNTTQPVATDDSDTTAPVGTDTPPVDTDSATVDTDTTPPAPTQHANCPVYVSKSGSDDNSGASWSEPLLTPHTAMAKAKEYVADSDGSTYCEIWIAKGTYTPGPANSTNQTLFIPLESHVHMMGGFAGDETHPLQRNISLNETILSPDLFGDDEGDMANGFENREENSFRILSTPEGEAINDAIIDGFVLEGHQTSPKAQSSAIIIGNSSVRFVNCAFRSNIGRMIHVSNSNLIIENGLFAGNDYSDTTLLHISSGSVTLTNTSFIENRGTSAAQIYSTDDAITTIQNCRFLYNQFDEDSTLLATPGYPWSGEKFYISSSLFANNSMRIVSATGYTGVFHIYNSVFRDTDHILIVMPDQPFVNNTVYSSDAKVALTADIKNSIVVADKEVILGVGGDASVEYSFIQGGCFQSDAKECLEGTLGHDVTHTVEFTDTENGDLSVLPTSSTIDAGNASLLPDDISLDFAGQARISGTTIDMGAYEYPVTP
ncbi:MAG: hypothetical protein JXX14_02565 [Deltaproteobacteria bacterium]|nr:hypothetical protein [Deltaproteobacteria bacterium]